MFRAEELDTAIYALQDAIGSLELSGADCASGVIADLKGMIDEMQEELDSYNTRIEAEESERYERERREMLAEYWSMVK